MSFFIEAFDLPAKKRVNAFRTKFVGAFVSDWFEFVIHIHDKL